MKIEAPCRLGERFTSAVPHDPGRFVLTGMSFFAWSFEGADCVTLYGKQYPEDQQEATCYFHPPKDFREDVGISFEVPDHFAKPGCPMRELGFDSGGVGWLAGVLWASEQDRDKPMFASRKWTYVLKHGKDYGTCPVYKHSALLDELFDQVLPLHAVALNAADFFM